MVPVVVLLWSSLALAGEPAVVEDGGGDSAPGEEPVQPALEPVPADDPPQGGGWTALSVPVDFGSALDTVVEDAGRIQAEDPQRLEDVLSVDELASELAGELPLSGSMAARLLPRLLTQLDDPATLRGRFFLRPRLAAAGILGEQGATGVALALVVGHQWWSLRERTLSPVGETRLGGVARVGGVHGAELSLDSTGGLWLGPVGVLAGPSLCWGKQVDDAGAGLAPALVVGPQLRLAANAGPLTPWAAATPGWIVAGGRAPLDAPWQDLRVDAGLVWDHRPVGLRFEVSWRDGALADAWQATVGLQLRLL